MRLTPGLWAVTIYLYQLLNTGVCTSGLWHGIMHNIKPVLSWEWKQRLFWAFHKTDKDFGALKKGKRKGSVKATPRPPTPESKINKGKREEKLKDPTLLNITIPCDFR